jgi:glutaredoxin
MKQKKVEGDNKHHQVILYSLSTCGWCKKTKEFLKEQNIEYYYVDVDLLSREEREDIRNKILDKGGRLSYPAIIIDDKKVINGFNKEKIIKNFKTSAR